MRELGQGEFHPRAHERDTKAGALARPTSRVDDELWRLLLRNTRELISQYEQHVHPSYLAGFRLLFDGSDRIPTVDQLNAKLSRFGWQTKLVDGYLPHHTYAKLLAARTFPVATHLRSIRDVEHSPVPDLAHDMIGHLPMLLDPSHRKFLQRLGNVMSRAKSNAGDHRLYLAQQRAGFLRQTDLRSPAMLEAADIQIARAEADVACCPSAIARLSRLYLWTIEFGLLGEPDGWTAYGAALLSSGRELEQAMSGRSHVIPLSVEAIDAPISFCDPQRRYYLASDHATLHDVLDCVLQLEER